LHSHKESFQIDYQGSLSAGGKQLQACHGYGPAMEPLEPVTKGLSFPIFTDAETLGKPKRDDPT
jgi:hypothetical protein